MDVTTQRLQFSSAENETMICLFSCTSLCLSQVFVRLCYNWCRFILFLISFFTCFLFSFSKVFVSFSMYQADERGAILILHHYSWLVPPGSALSLWPATLMSHVVGRVARKNGRVRFSQILSLIWCIQISGSLVLACDGTVNITNSNSSNMYWQESIPILNPHLQPDTRSNGLHNEAQIEERFHQENSCTSWN